MFSWKGNVDGSTLSLAKQLPTLLNNLRLVNVSGGAATASIYLINNDAELIAIAPVGNSINAGEMYCEEEANIVVLASEQVRIETSASFDYVFNFDNLPFPK